MKIHPHKLFYGMLITALAVAGCSKEYSASGYAHTTSIEDSFNLTLNFRPMVDTVKLKQDSNYRNYWKEPYNVSAFKFYLSKFDLINTDSGRAYHLNADKFFLVDAFDSTTWTVKLLAPTFMYNRISFQIGMDTTLTTGKKQTGVLDPAKGMYWDAANGYIMAKLEGSSSGNKFAYDIGGVKAGNNVLRTPTLLFPFGQTLMITPGHKCSLNLDANANAWFFNPHQLKIGSNPNCTSPGQTAMDISENYSKMFSVTAVVNN